MHKTYDWHLLEFIELTVGGSKIIIIIIHLLFASSSSFSCCCCCCHLFLECVVDVIEIPKYWNNNRESLKKDVKQKI